MTATRSRNVLIACVGLLAFLGLLFRFPGLLELVRNGELAWPRAVATVLGALLLLAACIGLLLRVPERGWTFAVAAIALLLGVFWLPTLMSSVWQWAAIAVACVGAIIGFRQGRGDSATD